MFVKTNFKGANMFKYTLGVFALNLILLVAFIATAIPYGVNIINHVEAFANTDALLSLMYIVKQIGWVVLWLIVAAIIEVALVFGVVMPMASSELKRGW